MTDVGGAERAPGHVQGGAGSDVADPSDGIYDSENNYRVQKFAREAPIAVQEGSWSSAKLRYLPPAPQR